MLASCDSNRGVSVENERKVIRQISAARARAFNEGNAAGIATHFSDDALLMAPVRHEAPERIVATAIDLPRNEGTLEVELNTVNP